MLACSSPPGQMPMTAWTARAWRPCAGTTAPSWPTSSLPPCDACSSTGEWDLPPAPEARPQPLSLRPRSPGPQPPPPLGTQVSGPARPQWWNGGKSVGLDSCGPRPRLCHLAPCGLAASLPVLGLSPQSISWPPQPQGWWRYQPRPWQPPATPPILALQRPRGRRGPRAGRHLRLAV